ncbi:MAG TPA: condensation domain-containing protein, partial [Micromonosporaceae bacterium]
MAERQAQQVEAAVAAAWHAALSSGSAEASVDPRLTFLTAGGHSLAAARLIARIRDTVGVQIALSALLRGDPTLAELTASVLAQDPAPDAAGPEQGAATQSGTGTRTAAIAPNLRRIWAWHRLFPDSPAYNVIRVLSVAGRVSPALLRAALGEVSVRHEALRCAVVEQRNQAPVIVVTEPAPVPLSVDVLDGAEPTDAAVDELVRRIADRPFDLTQAPLWRAGLIYAPQPRRSWLVLAMHHLISDLRASDLVLADLATAYQARADGLAPVFGPAAPSLLTHLAFEQSRPDDPGWAEALAWWRRELAEVAPRGRVEFGREAAREDTFAGAVHPVQISTADSAGIDQAARAGGLTPAIFFLTAAAAVLAAWSGTGEPEVIGVPSVRVGRPGDERLVGFALDTLPIVVDAEPDRSFAEAAEAIRDRMLGAIERSLVPYDAIVDALALPRVGTRSPLIRLWFNDLTQAGCPAEFGGFPAAEFDLAPTWALFDLGLYLRRFPDGYRLHLVVPRDLLQDGDGAALLNQVAGLATRAATDPEQRLVDLLARDGKEPAAITVGHPTSHPV